MNIVIACHNLKRFVYAIDHYHNNTNQCNMDIKWFWILSNDNLSDIQDAYELLKKYKDDILISRPNEGKDYGAYYYFAYLYNKFFDNSFTIFLTDDNTIYDKDWILKYNEGILDVDLVTSQMCLNHAGEKIPRGSGWGIRNNILKTLFNGNWPKPISTEIAYDQEMNLLPKFMRDNNFTMKQIGNFYDIICVENYGGKTIL
jgi:hypothetical protein